MFPSAAMASRGSAMPGGHHRLHVAAEEQHHRLVEGEHHRVEPLEHLGAGPGVAAEGGDALRPVPRRLAVEPGRMGEVVQGHHRLQARPRASPPVAAGSRPGPHRRSRPRRGSMRAHSRLIRKRWAPSLRGQPVILGPAVPVVHARAGDVRRPSARAPTRSSRSRCGPRPGTRRWRRRRGSRRGKRERRGASSRDRGSNPNSAASPARRSRVDSLTWRWRASLPSLLTHSASGDEPTPTRRD